MLLRESVWKLSKLRAAVLLLLLVSACAISARPETAAFDLIGPKVDVRVQRGGKTLPIAEVPNLQAGDRVWVHPDLPDSQSVRYLMVIVFLRGATNPPPENWFTRVETWNKAVRQEGVHVTVPNEAEEAIVLLAPETGGAFNTLRAAVRGKPGAFVRATQDLLQASLDRARLDRYLEAVRETSASDPDQLKAKTTLLARSLNIRLDQQCFDKPTAQQVPCLTQNTDQLVLDDAHSQNMVATLTTGAPTDLLAQLSSTPTARGGYYSPYIGAVVDVVRILGTAHSAQYQYIPALALPKHDELNLKLNNPPSFRNPKSVLVIGLPPVRPTLPPPLRAADATQISCLSKPGLVLTADGAPLVYATEMAHNFVLHVENESGEKQSGAGFDLAAKPDPAHGGFAIENHPLPASALDGEITGVLRGNWGFGQFDGPHFRLRISRAGQWTVASRDASALIVGREDTLHIKSYDASCVSEVMIRDEAGKQATVEWKAAKPDELEVKVPLQNASAGSLKMLVKKFGLHDADEIPLHTYAEASRLDSFSIHANDSDGVLKGTRLDEVTSLEVNGMTFNPENLSRANQQDELRLVSHDPLVTAAFDAGVPIVARVTLMDGRTLDLNAFVEPPRPKLALLSKNVQAGASDIPPMIHLGNPEELPQDSRLNFFLKSQLPEAFPPAEKVEVATADESFHVVLSVKDGNLTLQDSRTVFAVLDPMKLLGPSAFGPLKFRPIGSDGVEGDWMPLMNLVRVPELKGVHCVPSAKAAEVNAKEINATEKAPSSEKGTSSAKTEENCMLTGDKLFLIDAVSADPDFTGAVTVPDGFVDAALSIPSPKGKTLYIKLRDDPATVNTAVVPMLSSEP